MVRDTSNNGSLAINVTLPEMPETDPGWVPSEAVAAMLLTVNGANADAPVDRDCREIVPRVDAPSSVLPLCAAKLNCGSEGLDVCMAAAARPELPAAAPQLAKRPAGAARVKLRLVRLTVEYRLTGTEVWLPMSTALEPMVT